MFGATFKDIKPGDRVRFRIANGLKIRRGRSMPDFVVRTAKVNPLLLFEDHVVVNYGTCGQVVDAGNYLGHGSPSGRTK